MVKSKRDRENDKKFQAVARKKDIQTLYVQLRELTVLRTQEFLAEKDRIEKHFSAINGQFVKLQTEAKGVLHDCERRILDYSYALDNMPPPFQGQGLLSQELLERGGEISKRLSKSVLDFVPEQEVSVIESPVWIEGPVESDADALESEDDDSEVSDYDESLDNI